MPASAWKQVVDAAAKAETPAEQVELPFDLESEHLAARREARARRALDGVETDARVRLASTLGAMLTRRDGRGPAGRTPAAALPPSFEQQVAEAVKKADFDVYVGKEDQILRRAQRRSRPRARQR